MAEWLRRVTQVFRKLAHLQSVSHSRRATCVGSNPTPFKLTMVRYLFGFCMVSFECFSRNALRCRLPVRGFWLGFCFSFSFSRRLSCFLPDPVLAWRTQARPKTLAQTTSLFPQPKVSQAAISRTFERVRRERRQQSRRAHPECTHSSISAAYEGHAMRTRRWRRWRLERCAIWYRLEPGGMPEV